MAYGLNKNLLSKKGVINVYESWNVNGVQDTSNNNKKYSNDLLTSHSSYFNKVNNQNNVRYSTTILPPKPYPSTSQRPSTCASLKIIRSTASLPCRPSTANNCTRFHDNMLKALMRNIDKYCGKDGKNEISSNTLPAPTNVNQEKDKKKKNMLESQTMVDIGKFKKHHQKNNETVENYENNGQNQKNMKLIGNNRKKSKLKATRKDISEDTAINGPKTPANSGNSRWKDGKIKDTVNEDAAWEITDSDQIINLVMPKETRNATLTLLNQKKFNDTKRLTCQNNNNIFGNVPPEMRKAVNPPFKPLNKGGKSLVRDGGNVLENDFQSLNVCPQNLLCDGKNCNHRMSTKKLAYSQPHLNKNNLI